MNWKMNQKRWAWILSGVAAAPLGIAISLAGMHNLIGEAAQPPTDASASAPGGGAPGGDPLGGGPSSGGGPAGGFPFGSAAGGDSGGAEFGAQEAATGLPSRQGGSGTTINGQQEPNPPARQTAPRASRNRSVDAQSPNSPSAPRRGLPTSPLLPPAIDTPHNFPGTQYPPSQLLPLASTYPGHSYRYVQPDQKDLEYQQETHQLLLQYRTKANDPEEKQSIKNELSEVLYEQFDHRIANREKELTELKKQVEELEQLLGQRKKNRKEIVERRLLEITGGHDPMSWDSSTEHSPFMYSQMYSASPARIVQPPEQKLPLQYGLPPASPPEVPTNSSR